jgi:hypothetical protein
MPPALIVFAKLPVPGQVKTRLTTVLSSEDAARLYAAFLRDALVQYTSLGVAVRLYLAPPVLEVPLDLVPPGIPIFWQQGDGLGARMQRAFLETFAAGYERIVIIGTDHPTLPSAFLHLAFEALAAPNSLSIGPSDDGGYYLLGMNEFYPQVFADMTYSHPAVFEHTLDRIAQTPAACTVLPAWYDVDTPETLARLVGDLQDPSVEAPATRRLVQALGL